MFANKLKLNPEKTEFILIGSKNNCKQLLPHFPINILGIQLSPAQSVRNFGVAFDSKFSFSDHVSQVIKSTRVHTRDLYRIHPLLDLNTSVLLANALVSSKLDYCNSLFLSLTEFELRRLQLIQNSLCRVVTRSSKYSHITPHLKNSTGSLSNIGYNSKLVSLHTKFSTRVIPTPLPGIQGEVPLNSSSFTPPHLTVRFIN